jgi:hypothetical protein
MGVEGSRLSKSDSCLRGGGVEGSRASWNARVLAWAARATVEAVLLITRRGGGGGGLG